ncbi:MAG: N-acetylmuramoyl-L-alanine amidase, partial [Akkermansiaceae bacterium]|nr:N-acetylmuramoyl-L-alanine amidase [Akkermansiaceae bacterium]
MRAHEGLVFPVSGRRGDFFEVLTPCNDSRLVAASEVAFTPAVPLLPVGDGFDFANAVIVLDPGHGGPNFGATGPSGQREKDVNLDIARRVRDILSTSHTINWATGEILDGTAIAAAGQVWVTRTEGPEGADIESGLTFRTSLANSLNAHALISIHNNAAPDGPFEGPGSEVYHQYLDD